MRTSKVLLSIIFIWLCLVPLLSVNCDDDDDDDEQKYEKMKLNVALCNSHEDCYKIIGLNTYCCKYDGCCNWFSFVVFYNQQKTTEIPYRGPSLLYIAIISIICLLLLIFICCVCCLCCLCKQCGCCKKNKKSSRPIYTHVNSGRSNHNYQAYIPIATTTQTVVPLSPPSQQQQQTSRYDSRSVFNIQPAPQRIQPSAPVPEDPLLINDLMHSDPTAPLAEFDYDKPPAYDDVIRTGEVTVISETVVNNNAQRKH